MSLALLRRVEKIENRLNPAETLQVAVVKPGEAVETQGRAVICFELSDPASLGIPVTFHEAVDCWDD